MTKSRYLVQHLDRKERGVFETAMVTLGIVLRGPVVGLIVLDEDGRLCVVTVPGTSRTVLQSLAEADWKSLVRIAEEHTE